MTPGRSDDAIERQTLELARELIACRSITPDDGGAMAIVEARLARAGFACERIDRGPVRNLWARWGETAPLVCFAGHVDVVPPGPLGEWTSDPFTPTVRDGRLFGRGASDMKGPLAAMITAAERMAVGDVGRLVLDVGRLALDVGTALDDGRSTLGAGGSIAVLVTSDEEGDAVDGTAAVVEHLRARGVAIDACIVGEPTSTERLGDTIKHGRRGSLSGELVVAGIQCHIAYPERGRNPIQSALPALAELAATTWDAGNADFPPTSFQFSNVHAGTGAANVIPGTLEAAFNFRFSPETTAEALQERVRQVLDRHGLEYRLTWKPIARPFVTKRGPLLDSLARAIADATGVTPSFSTSGGTSDGRFLATLAAEVAEFGPTNETIHKVDENVRVADLGVLSRIYEQAAAARLGPAFSS